MIQCQKFLKSKQQCKYKITSESPFCKRHSSDDSMTLLRQIKETINDANISERSYNACIALEEKKWKMIALKSIPQPEQRSAEWFALRKLRITASEAAKCIAWDEYLSELRDRGVLHADPKKYKIGKTCNAYETKNNYMCVKAGLLPQPYIKEEYVQWGVKYEPIATSFYEYLYKTNVHEFGLLPHPYYDFIGASPDGITDDLVMLEIKCPKTNRDVGPPVVYYWIQMQMQMEVADLDVCDFFDVRIREYDSETAMLADDSRVKGILLELYDFVTGKIDYFYPTFTTNLSQQYSEVRSYIQSLSEFDMESYFYGRKKAEMIYWYIDEYSCNRIHREKKWFHETALPQLRDTWNDIVRLQKGKESGNDQEFIDSVMPKRRKKKVVEEHVPTPISFFQGSALASSDDEQDDVSKEKIIFLE